MAQPIRPGQGREPHEPDAKLAIVGYYEDRIETADDDHVQVLVGLKMSRPLTEFEYKLATDETYGQGLRFLPGNRRVTVKLIYSRLEQELGEIDAQLAELERAGAAAQQRHDQTIANAKEALSSYPWP